jgi:succinate dehydrogenase / fumarate reductase flavoprotein subunit
MLANCLIFGAKAGRAAKEWASKNPPKVSIDTPAKRVLERIRGIESKSGKRTPTELREILQRSAWNHALVVRSESGLKRMLDDLNELRSEFETSMGTSKPLEVIQALELANLLLIGEVVAQTALRREESRGGHYREDFPERITDRPPDGIIVSQDPDEKLKLEETVIDPEWRDELSDLGKARWG